jgi:hypothetical protein
VRAVAAREENESQKGGSRRPRAGVRVERSSVAYLCICTRGADCTRMNARLVRASPTVWSTRRIRGRSERVGWWCCDDSAARALRALWEKQQSVVCRGAREC